MGNFGTWDPYVNYERSYGGKGRKGSGKGGKGMGKGKGGGYWNGGDGKGKGGCNCAISFGIFEHADYEGGELQRRNIVDGCKQQKRGLHAAMLRFWYAPFAPGAISTCFEVLLWHA